MYSNNIVTESGDSFIPASQRPDGTWRKARRVKEGYVPQEEVPLYESKGKQFMNRNTKPEPIKLSTGETAQRPIPGLFIIEDKEKKPSKKKNKNKVEEVTKQIEHVTISEKPKEPSTQTDPAKKLKNLKKRLREVEALEEKLKNGLILKPEPEQLTKIQRKNDLLMQIRELEKQIG
ncbi:Mago-bind domain containing protein [Asbolus verrucosus]|uniref:Partner of Y14 and mago n=1 Tax=Asbolus verrucosus TaxID=1661398 RepID=A0A482WE43_ASBVE|nr:Mago-bind domain containing protein [Asbolus verrucosus]